MPVDTVISGGTIVTTNGQLEKSLAIDGEKIVAVGCDAAMPEAKEIVNAADYLVLPGVVDPHVHIGDMFSNDDYLSASEAAAAGGTTTVIDFAWSGWQGEICPWDSFDGLIDGIRQKKTEG